MCYSLARQCGSRTMNDDAQVAIQPVDPGLLAEHAVDTAGFINFMERLYGRV